MDNKTKKIIALKQYYGDDITWSDIASDPDVMLTPEAARSKYRRGMKVLPKDEVIPIEEFDTVDFPQVYGMTPLDYFPNREQLDKIWGRAKEDQIEYVKRLQARQYLQRIILPVPSALALPSDLHLGNKGTDYIACHSDATVIRDTERMYAGFVGDGIDNWIIQRLAGLERGQPIPFDDQWYLFFDYLDTLCEYDDLLFVLSGNHENWSIKLAGVDRLRDHLKKVKTLYHTHEIRFALQVGQRVYKVKARHKWRGHSIFNATHPIEVGWERGDIDFDIGIGGHTHLGTYCRPFNRHHRKRWAVLIGTYKVDDEYGYELGLPAPIDKGCGAMVFREDGTFAFMEELEHAADYLKFLCKKAKV